MADYHAKFRSNYFWVKDSAALLAWVNEIPDLECHRRTPSVEENCFAIFCDEGQPDWDESEREIDFLADLSKHLVEKEVAVVMEVGWEGFRYLVGAAQAVHSSGRIITVSLTDIYERAETAFGVDVTRAEY